MIKRNILYCLLLAIVSSLTLTVSLTQYIPDWSIPKFIVFSLIFALLFLVLYSSFYCILEKKQIKLNLYLSFLALFSIIGIDTFFVAISVRSYTIGIISVFSILLTLLFILLAMIEEKKKQS